MQDPTVMPGTGSGRPPGVAPDAVIAVVGAGTMGAGIALVAARVGHRVLLLDATPGAADRGRTVVRQRLTRDVAAGHLDAAQAAAAADRVTVAESVAALAGCAVVVEAVAEDLAVKRALIAQLDSVLAPDAIVATNTSSLSVTALATGSAHPRRVIGLHFFNPADRMQLVEVVRGEDTDPEIVEVAQDLVRSWGKTPVVAASTPGFVVNRVARPFYGEAQRLVEEGVANEATVDALLVEAGGFPLGPFALADLVGQDVNLAVSRSVWDQTFHDPRYAPTQLQQRLVDAGRLGRKTGRGVYRYDDDGQAQNAGPVTEPPQRAPDRIDLLVDADLVAADEDPLVVAFPRMAPFLARVAAAGVRLEISATDMPTLADPVEDEGEEPPVPGLRLPGGAVMFETDGSAARDVWAGWAPVVLLDWAHDPATCTRVALTFDPEVPQRSREAAIGLCQATGAAVSVIDDSPGMVVARTVSMLVTEAVDLVARGEATAQDVDVAMLLGTRWPSGPLEWGDRLGADAVLDVMEALATDAPGGRYRPSRTLRRLLLSGERLRSL